MPTQPKIGSYNLKDDLSAIDENFTMENRTSNQYNKSGMNSNTKS